MRQVSRQTGRPAFGALQEQSRSSQMKQVRWITLGAVAAVGAIRKWSFKAPQWATGFAAVAIVACAWVFALNN